MPVIFQKRIYREDLKANRRVIYVFGDNEERWGLGGQAAEMRGEPNAVGVATLRAPGRYWSDDDLANNCAVIDRDLELVGNALRQGQIVIWPLDNIGSGLADLENRAPATWAALQSKICELMNISGDGK